MNVRIVLAAAAVVLCSGANAAGLKGLLESVSRRADVPSASVRNLDDFVRSGRRLSGLADAAPPGVKRWADLEPEAARRAAYVEEGAGLTKAAVPSLGDRARLLEEIGPEGLAVIGLRGRTAADDLYAVGLKAERGAWPDGVPTPTHRDYVEMATDPVRWDFWQTYVEPHKGKWFAGGAAAVYLTSPETFHGPLGDLTEHAVETIGELGGTVVAAAVDGAGRAAEAAVGRVGDALFRQLTPVRMAGVALMFLAAAAAVRFALRRRRAGV